MTRTMNALVKRLDTTRPTNWRARTRGSWVRMARRTPKNAAQDDGRVGINYQDSDYGQVPRRVSRQAHRQRRKIPPRFMTRGGDTHPIVSKAVDSSYDDVFQGSG